jgi:hypothetical protein
MAFHAATPLLSGQQLSTVAQRNGNLFIVADHKEKQLTFEGLDSHPSIAPDRQSVVFVRRTPGFEIATGLGPADRNEIRSIELSTGNHVVIARGYAGGFEPKSPDLVFAGFSYPRYSSDLRYIFVVAETWATGSSIRRVPVKGKRPVEYVCKGDAVEPILSGPWSGYVVVHKETRALGHVYEYVLLSPSLVEVRRLGSDEKVIAQVQSGKLK